MTDLRHDPEAPPPAPVATELGYAPMDTIHAELEALLEQAGTCSGNAWLPLLSQIEAHLRSHFAAEDQWMRETAFPPRDCHMDEHAAVLNSAKEVLALAQGGDHGPAPSFVAALAQWFPGHAAYLDSALAAWMCKRQFGGRPVVLHRRRAGTDER